MSDEIVFERARIVAVEHRRSTGTVSSRMKIVAIATAKIAKALDAGWVLDKDALAKHSFTPVKLDYEMKNVRTRHAIGKISAIETTSAMAYRFVVYRTGGEKKDSHQLMVSFIVENSGSPFDILEHWMKVGDSEGTCTITALQSEMFGKEEAKKPERQKSLSTPKKATAPVVNETAAVVN